MKKVLCIVLTLACIFAFSSCQLWDYFVSYEAIQATTPEDLNRGDPQDFDPIPEKKPDSTTPDDKHEQTDPEDPPRDANNNGIPDDQENTDGTPKEDFTDLGEQEIYFSVQVVFQSGGIHRVEETFEVKELCTFNQLYTLFVEKHFLDTFTLIPYLNGELVEMEKTYYLHAGDYIYLEEYSGMPGEEPVCAHEWIEGYCLRCGAMCNHSEWDVNRQCLVCGFSMGVEMIELEIHENGEYRYYTQTIGITVHDLVMAYYGYQPWESLESDYEFYYNGVRVEGSYWIAENGILNLVTRTEY